jgi:hypothetical protein
VELAREIGTNHPKAEVPDGLCKPVTCNFINFGDGVSLNLVMLARRRAVDPLLGRIPPNAQSVLT